MNLKYSPDMGRSGQLDFIPINLPMLGEEEKKAVLSVIESGKLTDSSYEGGRWVRSFESKMRELLGVKHVIAVNSGTAALHSVLLALGIKPGDEVVLPSFTFVATANVVLACGAKPVFVDTKADYNIDPVLLRKAINRRTKAVIPVHLYGYPADMDEVREVASARSIHVIEDAAESLGAEYKGRQTGTLSAAGCFSMYATKVATSGEGGAISTDSDELADNLRLVRNHGMVHGYDSRRLGFNYRLTELGAAIASVQMDKLASLLRIRAKNVAFLQERISRVKGASFTQNGRDRTHTHYLHTLFLRKNRDKVLGRLNAMGIGAAVYFKRPVHKTPLYEELGYGRVTLENTEEAARHVISLPVHPRLGPEEMERVAQGFLTAAARLL
ncbi:MAG: DegT/DnrJ/EryC1/StrS family aminotransferase [Nitrososphaerales archaeon]|jgi:perosamine synthetase